ncbi:MAG: hypothetical protein QOF51_2299, partial [Chloroflexota bacterium]|nr:hypothetical protein [Chloroflexota bacterium]
GPTATGSGRDFFGDPRFVHAQAGMATFSEVSFRNGSAPFVSLTSPRMSGGGVTIAELDLRFVGEVLDAANQTIGGDAYVVDDHGQLIAHADLARVLRHTDLKPLHQVQEALAAQALGTDSKRHTSVSRNAGGEPVLSSFQTMPRTGWSVFVEQPLDEAFAPAYESLRRTAYLLALGLIVSILISLALARGMVAPIWRLRIAAARIGDGAFDQRIEVHTGDELEALAGEFNRMSQRLQESHNTLEQRVEERTHDLAAAKATIEAQATQLTDWNRTLEARVVEEVDKNERLDRLRRFLTPQLADIVVEEDERALESHRRDITVVFTDLRGFTEFAEQAEPEEVMRVLHEYHEVMGELVFRYEGTLERFAGDGLMVFFNDPLPCPDPAQRAVRMALEMRERVRLLEQSWQRRGYQLGFGVGIAMGYATLGKIGFEGRYDYGAIGSVTNLASRLCDEAASGQILIGQRVFGEVEDLVEIEPLSPLALKGFSRPVPAYNVLALARVPELEPAALPTA